MQTRRLTSFVAAYHVHRQDVDGSDLVNMRRGHQASFGFGARLLSLFDSNDLLDCRCLYRRRVGVALPEGLSRYQ